MATITEPMALDKTFNTTETTPRSQADVLAAIESAIRQGFGQSAADVSYDNTTSGLTADDVQEAVDELAAEKVDKVEGKGLSSNDFTDEDKEALDNMELDIASTQTVSGNPLTLTDAAPINAESLVVELEPKQDLHGQSAPYVGGAGKNKCPLDVAELKTLNTDGTWTGNTYSVNNVTLAVQTDDDGNAIGILINGTASSAFEFLLSSGFAISDGEYIISGIPSNVPAGYQVIQAYVTNNGQDIIWSDRGSDTSLSTKTAESLNNLAVHLSIYSGYSASNLLYKPMIRLSTESADYSPYSNICPITGYDEVNVDDVGKNLLNPTVARASTYLGSTGEALGNNDWSVYLCKVDGLSTITISGITHEDSGTYFVWLADPDIVSSTNRVGVLGYHKNYTNVDIPSGAKYLAMSFLSSPSSANYDFDTAQVENGSQATAYEPYQSSNATIQFGQTVYGGKSNFTDGGTDDEWNKYDTWDTTWYKSSTEATILSKSISDKKSSVNEIKCNAYKYEANEGFNLSYGAISDSGVDVYKQAVFIRDTRFAGKTVAECVAILNSEGTYFVYQLETPENISTPPTDLKLLQGTNNITTNGTTINLGYQPDNVVGHTLEVAENYTDKAVGKNILPMTLAGIKAANPHLTWTDETSFTNGNVTVTFQVAGGDIYGIHIVSTGSNGEFFNLCFDGIDYSRFDGCILSGCDVNDENKIYIAIRKYGGANYFAKNISGDTVINYTAGQKASIFVYLSSGSVDTVLKPMIRKPNMDNTYEPPKPSKEILMDLIAYLFTQI